MYLTSPMLVRAAFTHSAALMKTLGFNGRAFNPLTAYSLSRFVQ